MSFYVTLRHAGMVQSTHHNGGKWVIVEHSGRFWVVIQRKEKWKKVNEVRHVLECGHDITSSRLV